MSQFIKSESADTAHAPRRLGLAAEPSPAELRAKWHLLNQQLRKYQDAVAQIRARKKEVEEQLSKSMGVTADFNPADVGPLDIPGDTGAIRMVVKNSYQSLTFTYIENVLSSILQQQAQIDIIMSHIRDHRRRDRVLEYVYESPEDQRKRAAAANKKRRAGADDEDEEEG